MHHFPEVSPPSALTGSHFLKSECGTQSSCNSLTWKRYPGAQHLPRRDLAAGRGLQRRSNCGAQSVTVNQVASTGPTEDGRPP